MQLFWFQGLALGSSPGGKNEWKLFLSKFEEYLSFLYTKMKCNKYYIKGKKEN